MTNSISSPLATNQRKKEFFFRWPSLSRGKNVSLNALTMRLSCPVFPPAFRPLRRTWILGLFARLLWWAAIRAAATGEMLLKKRIKVAAPQRLRLLLRLYQACLHPLALVWNVSQSFFFPPPAVTQPPLSIRLWLWTANRCYQGGQCLDWLPLQKPGLHKNLHVSLSTLAV